MIQRIFLPILTTSIVFLTSCAPRESLNTQQQSFLLEMSPNPQQQTEPVNGVLKIRYCRAASPFDAQHFLYRMEPGQYQHDFYKLFLSPPNEQVGDILRTWLEQSKIFQGVLPASSSAEADYFLEPTLMALYSDFSKPQSETVVKLHVVLLKMDRSLPSDVMLEKTYDGILPLQSNTSQQIIKNYNLCLEKILAQLQSDLLIVLKK